MREVTEEEAKIRRFLLNELEEAKRERLEELFLTDSSFREKVLLAESDLIDDYLEGELHKSDTEKFRQVFATTPIQSRKLRIAQLIRNYARKEYDAASNPRKAYIYVAIAATILVLLFAGIWLMRRVQFARYAAQEQARHTQTEQQLIAANNAATGSVESPEPRVTPRVLTSVSTRGSGPESSLSLGSGAEAFDLWLETTFTQYETYNATLKRIGSSEQFNLAGLRLQTGTQGKLVRVRIPARLFPRGVYEIALTAVAPDGQPVYAGRFTFQLTD